MNTMTREQAASEYKQYRSFCMVYQNRTKESVDAEARTTVEALGDNSPEAWVMAVHQIHNAHYYATESAQATLLCADFDAYEAAVVAKDAEGMLKAAQSMGEHGWINHIDYSFAWGVAMTCKYPETKRDYVVAQAWEDAPKVANACRRSCYRWMNDRGHTPRVIVHEGMPWLDGDPCYMDRYAKAV